MTSGFQFDLSPEQEAPRNKARHPVEEVISAHAADVDRTEQYPWAIAGALKDAGITGMLFARVFDEVGAAA